MIILGIETSCDETAASVVENGTKVLSHVLATSADMHTKTGGIIPEVAAREQLKSIMPVIEQALAGSLSHIANGKNETISHMQLAIDQIDAIAVTGGGPGLIGSMLVGVETAKTLAWVWNKPIVPVVHLLGHMYANWLLSDEQTNRQIENRSNHLLPEFPAIVLTVSGGHTELILMKGHGKFQMLGGTRDDSAGEAFDKTARLLGLPYPGGPEISKAADNYFRSVGTSSAYPGGPAIAEAAMEYQISNDKLQIFPRPMIGENNFDFSFSGLKTAVAREVDKVKATKQLDNEDIQKLAAEIQEAIADVLSAKAVAAARKHKVKSLLIAGGVAANQRFRELTIERSPVPVFIPPIQYCTDNGSFIASYAYFNYHPRPWQKIIAIPDADEAIKIYAKN